MAKKGTLTLDGFKIQAEVIEPGFLKVRIPGALSISSQGMKTPRGNAMPCAFVRGADVQTFTSLRSWIRRDGYEPLPVRKRKG
ncbi:MAG: hypothetical protein WC728_14470 [Elusimicrobiota bacterium]